MINSVLRNSHVVPKTAITADSHDSAECPPWLLWTTVICVCLLNLEPVNAKIGILLVLFLCTFSLSKPLPAVVWITASQTVGDAVGLPLTNAQMIFIFFFFHLIFLNRNFNWREAGFLIRWLLLPLLYLRIIITIKWGFSSSITPLELAVFFSFVGFCYLYQLRHRPFDALLMVGLGCLPTIVAFPLSLAGINITGESVTKIQGITSMPLGRSDGNQAGIGIANCIAIFLGLATFTGPCMFSRKKRIVLAILCSLCAIPAAIVTLSRATILYVTIIVMSLFLIQFHLGRKRQIFWIFLGGVFISSGIFIFWGELVETYFEHIFQFSQEQLTSADSLFLSRQGVFVASWTEIAQSPLLGTLPETRVAADAYGYNYNSHNAWLDMGRAAGIPGMIFFTCFFFCPVIRLLKMRRIHLTYPFLLPWLVIFCVLMNLSQTNNKIIYVLWVLLMILQLPPEDMCNGSSDNAIQPQYVFPDKSEKIRSLERCITGTTHYSLADGQKKQ